MNTYDNFGRRLLSAVLLTGAVASGGAAFGVGTIASAEPREWDIGGYDRCVDIMYKEYAKGAMTSEVLDTALMHCCLEYGGQWSESQGCVAPPADVADSPRTSPGRVPTHAFEPDTLPEAQQPGNIGTVTQTFEPAPVG